MKLADLILEKGNCIEKACSGRGTCGKCKVIIKDDNVPSSNADRFFFSENELQLGYRLSCQMEVDKDFDLDKVVIPDLSDKMDVLTIKTDKQPEGIDTSDTYDIAIDIGTTTIAFALVINEEVIDTYGIENRQKVCGADVISRIDVAISGKADVLNSIIVDCLNEGIDYLINKNGLMLNRLKHIVVAGNTTMLHILCNYSLEGLSKYPFKPVSLDMEKHDAVSLLGRDDILSAEIIILPGISSFIGADIVSGLFYLSDRFDDNVLFIDLGTNGEIALINDDKISVTSTAAGPAFEGVNITCGCPSINGAICDLDIRSNGKVTYKSIGGKTPIGICGSGIIAAISEMLDNNIIDKSGIYSTEYCDSGFAIIGNIIIKQSDIREFQMAKAAIRTGIETLIKSEGIDVADINKVLLAGGFGNSIIISKAKNVGIFDKKMNCQFEVVGNTSLLGCVKFILTENAEEKCKAIVKKCKDIVLANEETFNNSFISNIDFD